MRWKRADDPSCASLSRAMILPSANSPGAISTVISARSKPWTLTSPPCFMPGIGSRQKARSNRLWPREKLFSPTVTLAPISRTSRNASSPEQRNEFIAWLKHVEYGIYGLPVEDLVVYLRIPAPEAFRLIGLKAPRSYTSLRHDILEADVTHLEQTAGIYDRLATEPNWVRIDCTNLASGILYSPEEIHQAVLDAVESRVIPQAPAKR